ncbi:hypothetical protein DSCO28_48050 [Desulfosarcina ovata subsp. sediminis]|uniref:Helicase ATP-binding domain-containing protein n=1 Tax=Desulfosarcina ovata subsp. sediminis TaxID=885957 RepID=A0A5K7ZVH9_9BACT|nr:hypothetical protein [Desulfosarcina ovata]BBO84239.1 hypothetical protein DSCO28_48050 [Desulfosarcina ovata subsp. sediminis]
MVVDEAHKMSASYFGSKINRTKRFLLGELLFDAKRTRHFLMMTATPHNGKEADRLDGKRKGTIGFALTILQRRLASFPEAIYQSLKRRRKRLDQRVEEEKSQYWSDCIAETLAAYSAAEVYDDIDDELTGEEFEDLSDRLVDQATAAETIHELHAEIDILKALEQQAKQVVHSGKDRKWDEFSRLLQNAPNMHDASGVRRKLIILKTRVAGSRNCVHAWRSGTRNEILYGLNQQEKFRLAIVLVDENDDVDGPYYIRNPFGQEPDWGVASINYDLSELIARAQPFC